jgi:hypothetical protein
MAQLLICHTSPGSGQHEEILAIEPDADDEPKSWIFELKKIL